jgi:DNA-3-methyladenine glycosylase II
MPTQSPFSESINTAIAYLAQIDPTMASIIELIGPCTLQPDPDVFEALVDAIISQQISVKAADAIMARIRAALSDGLVAPDTLMPFDVDKLRTLGLSPQKARYIRNLLEHIASGALDLVQLTMLDDEAVISKLVEVKGIGRWTAEMILIYWTQYHQNIPLSYNVACDLLSKQ